MLQPGARTGSAGSRRLTLPTGSTPRRARPPPETRGPQHLLRRKWSYGSQAASVIAGGAIHRPDWSPHGRQPPGGMTTFVRPVTVRTSSPARTPRRSLDTHGPGAGRGDPTRPIRGMPASAAVIAVDPDETADQYDGTQGESNPRRHGGCCYRPNQWFHPHGAQQPASRRVTSLRRLSVSSMRQFLRIVQRVAGASRQRSVRSSGGSLPCGRARVCRCVRSSNGAHTVHRWAKLPKPCWPPGPWRVEPLVWSELRRPPTWLTSRCTGPLASPALLLPCSSFVHPTNSRRACRQAS